MIGVTRILTTAGRIDARFFSPDAAERGTLLHALTEQFDAGTLRRVPDGLHGFMDAYAAFVGTVRPIYGSPDWWHRSAMLADSPTYGHLLDDGNSVERYVQHARLGVRGRIDRLCVDILGYPAVLDLKFGAPLPWHAIQLAAYHRLCPAGARFAVYMTIDGRYKVRQYSDPRDDRRFMADLDTARRRLAA